ncbi:hypothetical protein B9Z55_021442 [Caenorhabditis nigoni]|uniref:Uncharacterized protein n=1 Tax=Caenorhabditis nigoni TaxID=1611254 RepID=A0A2G5TRZ5_9PELO|nr:hypothetical protein B9Z55_021442 [Caenorhabditis nigoni]
MRLLLVILLILHNLPLKNAYSIYDYSLPELKIENNHTVKIWNEIGLLDPNHTDIRFLFHSSQFGFRNPNFIQNVSDFLLMDNAFSTFNLISDATDDILENSANFSNFSKKTSLWIIDFQSQDYVKIFPQFEIRQLSCDEFDFYGKNRYFQEFDLLLLETYSPCGLKIHEEISKNSDSILQNLASKWKFYDIILLETAETRNYTYSPYPEYRKELRNLENMKKQRYFQNNVHIDEFHQLFRRWPKATFGLEMQLLIRLLHGWGPEDITRINVIYPLRRLFYFVITNSKIPEFSPQLMPLPFCVILVFGFLILPPTRVNVVRQLMLLELIYIVAKYTVDDTRSVIWPFLLVHEIWDVVTVFKYRTTQYLPFGLQLWKMHETFYHFILLNQYPDFYILIWLTVIASLQIVSFSLYFLFPPLTWTVPILDIAPTEAPRDPFSHYTRYMAIGTILLIVGLHFWTLF